MGFKSADTFRNTRGAPPMQTGFVSFHYSDHPTLVNPIAGERIVKTFVRFGGPEFAKCPTVHLSLGGFDSEHGNNLRYEVWAEGVTREGLTVALKTWEDTCIYWAKVNWLAVGI
jgi:hypothetical protein